MKSSYATVKSTISTSSSKKSVYSDPVAEPHDPSCSFYNLSAAVEKKQSYSTLSEAVTVYGVPPSLNKTLKDYYKFILDKNDDNIAIKARCSFLKTLEKQVRYCYTINIFG